MIRADQDREELAMLSEGIKNTVDELLVSRHFAEYSKFLTTHFIQVNGGVAIRIQQARDLVGTLLLNS